MVGRLIFRTREMRNKLVLKVFIVFILLGCTQAREIGVYFEFDHTTRKLNVELISSAQYLTKLDTKIKHDTLELVVYEKPVFLTFREKNKMASRIITVDKSIHFIQHRDSVYVLSKIKNPR